MGTGWRQWRLWPSQLWKDWREGTGWRQWRLWPSWLWKDWREGTGWRQWRLWPRQLWKDSREGAERDRHWEEVPFRDCTGEERVEEDMVLCLVLVQFLCSSWSYGHSDGSSLLGLCLQGHCWFGGASPGMHTCTHTHKHTCQHACVHMQAHKHTHSLS